MAQALSVALGAGAAGGGLSEAGKARLIEEVTRAVEEEQGGSTAAAAAAAGGTVSGTAAAATADSGSTSDGDGGRGDGDGNGDKDDGRFRLPGELPPGREQAEAEEVMRLLFEHLKTEEGR